MLFHRLYALSMDQWVVVWRAWNDEWVPPLPQALSDQRVAELISTQELVADRRLLLGSARRVEYGAAIVLPLEPHTD